MPKSIILAEPPFIPQQKAFSCWYACLKMLLAWHEQERSIQNQEVSSLTSWLHAIRLSQLPVGFLTTRNLVVEETEFQNTDEIANELQRVGPFIGGGSVGKAFIAFGPRVYGHAILVYGVLPSGHVLHHDPIDGRSKKMKGDSYLRHQDGEWLHYHSARALVTITSMGG